MYINIYPVRWSPFFIPSNPSQSCLVTDDYHTCFLCPPSNTSILVSPVEFFKPYKARQHQRKPGDHLVLFHKTWFRMGDIWQVFFRILLSVRSWDIVYYIFCTSDFPCAVWDGVDVACRRLVAFSWPFSKCSAIAQPSNAASENMFIVITNQCSEGVKINVLSSWFPT